MFVETCRAGCAGVRICRVALCPHIIHLTAACCMAAHSRVPAPSCCQATGASSAASLLPPTLLLQEKGLDTVDANRALGLPDDCREYSPVRFILEELGVKSVRLMVGSLPGCGAVACCACCAGGPLCGCCRQCSSATVPCSPFLTHTYHATHKLLPNTPHPPFHAPQTNNPRKISELSQLGITVTGRIPCLVKAQKYNTGGWVGRSSECT